MDIQKLIVFCVTKLVDKPEVVTVTQKDSHGGKSMYEIRVASQDLARVIGKEGRTFKALRALVTLVAPEQVHDIVVDTAT